MARSARPRAVRRPRQKSTACARFLGRAAKAAKAHGLKLGIEPCNRCETHLINRGIDAARIIERVDAGNVFIHLDTYHMHIERRALPPASPRRHLSSVTSMSRRPIAVCRGAACSTGGRA
ncbi:TIM barrel protein [Mesorhizobium sp. M1396]|uniref:TIM barrel protein n=1 Tax=Mesorhizobium sp. M1396 TaxID=2957095 RepID=UPI00333C72EF